MIFSRFFSPSHASKNPQTRIDAIADLSPQKASEKAILHELAFNDDNAEVSLTALRKLNSFALWQKMAQIACDSKVKKVAQQHVEQAVLGRNSLVLDAAERRAYLLESASADLITKALNEDDWLLEQEELTVKLLNRLAKPTVLQTYFLRRATPSLQQKLVATVDDPALLTRLQKKTSSSATQQLIEQRLAVLSERKQKPIEIEKQATLVLSKRLALLEKADYEDILARAEGLQREYGELESEFACLTADTRDTLQAKHDRITGQIERHLERLKPQWELQQKQARTIALADNANQALGAAQAEIKKLFTKPINYASRQDIESVRSALANTAAQIDKARVQVESAQLTSLQRQYEKLLVSMDDIESQQGAAARMEALIIEAESLDVDNEDELQSYPGLAKEWQQLKQSVLVVPDDWQERWRKQEALVKRVRQKAEADQDQKVKQCKRHISAISGLIDNGKFRPAISRFGKLQECYDALTDSTKEVLATRYQQVREQIERLEGWQSYLAAPRKPVLLEEAKQLADTTPDDIQQRTASIKYLRQQWNSLGGGASSDDELKAEFDNYLEQAFAPCREFYAQQEQLREQAAAYREGLISEATALDGTENVAELAKQLEKMKKQWREAPVVDKERYQQLKQRWEKTIDPLNTAVNSWQQGNKEAKQGLIDKAQTLLDLDDFNQATEQARQLQEQWKAIGPAGRRQEAKLWQSFRSINDAIFAKRKQIKRELDDEAAQVAEKLLAGLNALEQSASVKPIGETEQALDGMESEVQSAELPRAMSARLVRKINELRQLLSSRKVINRVERRRDQLEALIDVFCAWAPEEQNAEASVSSDLWERLGKNEQIALSGSESPPRDREWLTVTLEVVLDVATPAQNALKQNVQLSLMTAKLERGEDADVDAIIAQWAEWGPVPEEQQSLFTRFTTCIYRHLETLEQEKR